MKKAKLTVASIKTKIELLTNNNKQLNELFEFEQKKGAKLSSELAFEKKENIGKTQHVIEKETTSDDSDDEVFYQLINRVIFELILKVIYLKIKLKNFFFKVSLEDGSVNSKDSILPKYDYKYY